MLMEKLIRKRIIQHMDKFDLFSIKQFGFMGGRSTTLQLLQVLDHWTTILDNGGTIDTIYTDFMKTFDKVPHIRLINKLHSYGISNQTCVWVKNFLSNPTRYGTGTSIICIIYQRFTAECRI